MRLVPDRDFPPYAYAPGEHPHPTNDPQGHSFGIAEAADPLAFEWGVDLYENGFYWEAHEAWESLWRASTGDEKTLLRGLIQSAAACLKVRVGQQQGARRLGRRAAEHLRTIEGRCRGMDARAFADALERWLRGDPEDAEGRPRIADVLDR